MSDPNYTGCMACHPNPHIAQLRAEKDRARDFLAQERERIEAATAALPEDLRGLPLVEAVRCLRDGLEGAQAAAFKCCSRNAWGDGEHDPGCRHAAVMAVVEAARRWRHAMCGTKKERRERGLTARASEVFAALRAYDAALAASPPASAEGEREVAAFLAAHDRFHTYAHFTIEFASAWDEALAEDEMHHAGRLRAIVAAPRPPSSPDTNCDKCGRPCTDPDHHWGMCPTPASRRKPLDVHCTFEPAVKGATGGLCLHCGLPESDTLHAAPAPSPDPAPCPTCGGPGGYVEVDGLRVPKCCSPAPSPDPEAR